MLYLIGFMGVGKTTIGEQLAKQHNVNFIDIDKEIEATTNNSILNIFQKDGENHFRKLETATLKTISKNNIVACGGGLPVYNNNMDFIKKSGISIYLKASKNEIFIRLSDNSKNRPLIRNKSDEDLRDFIKETLTEREKFYSMANYTIETSNLSEKAVLRKINSLPLAI
jgi:shikimate kinase